MKDTKLIESLKTFSKDEMKSFEKLAASPFFNKGRNYMPLINELKKHYPEFSSDKLTSENIYKKIYPGRKFNKQVMWNLVSGLEKLAMEFLLQTSLKNNKAGRFELIFDELSKRNLDKEIFREIEIADKYINSVKMGKQYFSLKLTIENNKAEYWNLTKGRQDKTLDGTVKSTEYLMLNLIADLSIQVWDLHILKVMYGSGEEINSAIALVKSLNLKGLVNSLQNPGNKYSGVINFYYNKIMCAVDEVDENYFFEMKKYFEENYNKFDNEETRNTIITLANYCAHKLRLGNEKFLRILFELNKFRLEKEIETYRNGRMNKALYHQILRNALALDEIKWSEDFVKKYTPKLKREQQKTMNALALGYIYYAKKEYEESLVYLNKVELIDIRDKLHVRMLSAKAYYELNKTELLFYHIDSSKHFILNSTAIEINTREAYLKFFNHLNKLLTYRESPDKNKLKVLREDIDMDKIMRLRHKLWLLEKIDNL